MHKTHPLREALSAHLKTYRRNGLLDLRAFARAPKRKRPRRIAKKIAKRHGALHYAGDIGEITVSV